MKKYFKDFYGCSASITIKASGTAVLKVSDSYGKRFWNKEHKSERGARCAMAKLSDGWREVK